MHKGLNKQARRDFLRGIGVVTAGLFMSDYSATAQDFIRTKGTKTLHKILTCNIRVALPEDDTKGVGWNVRREICANIIRKQNPDIVCLQEVIKVQADDMRHFFPGFAFFGFEGPEMDRLPEGYHGIAKNVIMYSEERYKMVSAGCYWLSEKPFLGGSKSWDTGRARHMNWIRLKDQYSLMEFRVINTHLDNAVQNAREKQIGLVLEESEQYANDFPQLLAGDFNSDSQNNVIRMILDQDWKDTWTFMHGTLDPGFTHHGFLGMGKIQEADSIGKIDFIFCRGNIVTKKSEIIRDQENGLYPSDHFFVSAEVEIAET